MTFTERIRLSKKVDEYIEEHRIEHGTLSVITVLGFLGCDLNRSYVKYDIDVEKVGGNWCPYIKIKNQKFRLAPCEDKESAEWMGSQLRKAIMEP